MQSDRRRPVATPVGGATNSAADVALAGTPVCSPGPTDGSAPERSGDPCVCPDSLSWLFTVEHRQNVLPKPIQESPEALPRGNPSPSADDQKRRGWKSPTIPAEGPVRWKVRYGEIVRCLDRPTLFRRLSLDCSYSVSANPLREPEGFLVVNGPRAPPSAREAEYSGPPSG